MIKHMSNCFTNLQVEIMMAPCSFFFFFRYFTKAKDLIRSSDQEGNLGGILLGLGLVKERLNKPHEALSVLQEALKIYQNQFKSKLPKQVFAKKKTGTRFCQ